MVDIMSGESFDVYMHKKKFTANIENGILRLDGSCVDNDLLLKDEFVCSIDNKSALIGISRIIPNMVAMGCGKYDISLHIQYSYIVYPYHKSAKCKSISIDSSIGADYTFTKTVGIRDTIPELCRLYRAASLVLGNRIRLNKAYIHYGKDESTVYFGDINIEYGLHTTKNIDAKRLRSIIRIYMKQGSKFDFAVESFMQSFYMFGAPQFAITCPVSDSLAGVNFGFRTADGMKEGKTRYKNTKELLDDVRCHCFIEMPSSECNRLGNIRNTYSHGDDFSIQHSRLDLEVIRYFVYCQIAHILWIDPDIILPVEGHYMIEKIKKKYT